MKKGPVLFLVFLLFFLQIYAQNDTYWQQEVNYHISVELNDSAHVLQGFEEIEYVNNSPDELTFLYFHLWPNAYKNNKTAFARQQLETGDAAFHFAREDQRGYIDSLNFKVDGEEVTWEFHEEHIDICKISLNEPLQSGQSIRITTPFRVKIPYTFSRLGHVGRQYQISQWYPKPAVYDQNGWHPMPYLDMGEFYSEFGRFEVDITIPEDYVVAATGNLQNAEEQRKLDSLANETWQDALKRYAAPGRRETGENKTLTYIQENVHDFAWFAGKGYRLMQGEVELPHSGRTVRLQAFYNEFSYEVWQDIINYMRDAVYYYSLWIGDYPYDVVTVVDGALGAGSGMEYPTITVLGANNKFFLELVTMHEIGHNWFYGALGTNERLHAWMDEGINSYYERRYIKTNLPNASVTELLGGLTESSSLARWLAEHSGAAAIEFTDMYRLAYLAQARRNMDQPPDLHADKFTDANYGAMVYYKPAVIFHHLSEYLGGEEFDRIMQVYFNTWRFKHPQPEDLREIFERETGKDLGWVFDDLIRTTKTIDYKISGISREETGTIVRLKNTGDINSPYSVTAFKNGEAVEKKWVEGFNGETTVTFEAGDADRFVIDADTNTLELYRGDNFRSAHGTFPGIEPVQLKFLGAIEDPSKTQLFYIPAFGLNTRDKFMLGGALYNRVFPQKKFNFTLMPMYSFGLEKLAGSAEINYNIYPDDVFRRIRISGLAKSYAGYEKLEPRLEFTFNSDNLKTGAKQNLLFRYADIYVNQETLPSYENAYEIIEGRYGIEAGDAIWGYGLNTGLKINPGEFVSWESEAGFSFQYFRNAFLQGRFFYGRFLSGENIPAGFHYGLSGSFDYMMDDVFLDRAMISDDLTGFEKQTNLEHGGFRGFSPVSSGEWLFAFNLDADIPQFGLFSLFADLGFTESTSGLLYDAGFRITLINNVLDFYFPLVGEPYETTFPETFNGFFNNLRFRLQLQNLNPANTLYGN